MADIAMCEKKDCPSFTTCYRAQAVKSEYRQSYMYFDNGTDSCCDDCGGWDGESRRCDCGNRRVYWATTKLHNGTFAAHAEAY